jgi:hypothetical protein
MFDINADDGSVQKKAYRSPIPESGDGEPAVVPPDKLDSTANKELHRRLLTWYLQEVDRQRDNRMEMATDEDFYDSIQWTEQDAETLRDRGQLPLVYNVISTSINWIIGTEKQARTDYQILPRRKEDNKPAERKTQLFKYLSDVNREPFASSRAFEDAIKVGVGWMEDGVQDGDFEEPLYSRYESWRNLLHDSSATELDLSDARYIHRAKWLDEDIVCAMFPTRDELVKASVNESDTIYSRDVYGDEAMDQQEETLEENAFGRSGAPFDVFYQRRRVRVVETWFRTPVSVQRIKGGPFSGEIYDEASRGHKDSVEVGIATLAEKVVMRVHVAIFTIKGLLWLSESPFRHNQFPFTPYWCNKRGRDGLPYGVIRGLRGIQQDINKRASKALHILSTNKVVMDEGAVEDIEEFRDEVARPDAIIVKKPGKEINLNADRDIAQWHLEFMSRSISMIQSVSGVTDELMGRTTNAQSGIAVEKRQSQGILANAKPFDNYRYARQIRGEKQLSNIEQFISEKKAFRITNMRGKPEYPVVNDGLPENDIVRSKADFVISEADWNASIRGASVAALGEAIRTWPPEIGMKILDLMVENMDLPNREEIVRRIRSITGQRDPDAEEPTQEELQQQAAQQKQEQMAEAAFAANLKKTEADASYSAARADETRARMVGLGVDAQGKALTAAREAMAVPASADVADHIMHEAGFVSRSEKEEALAALAQQAQAEEDAAAQQAAMQQQQQQQQSQPQAEPGPPGIGPAPAGQ